jgi:bifunctional ADP-heptose synthase (sugar kinase/adenylyltransferase)
VPDDSTPGHADSCDTVAGFADSDIAAASTAGDTTMNEATALANQASSVAVVRDTATALQQQQQQQEEQQQQRRSVEDSTAESSDAESERDEQTREPPDDPTDDVADDVTADVSTTAPPAHTEVRCCY